MLCILGVLSPLLAAFTTRARYYCAGVEQQLRTAWHDGVWAHPTLINHARYLCASCPQGPQGNQPVSTTVAGTFHGGTAAGLGGYVPGRLHATVYVYRLSLKGVPPAAAAAVLPALPIAYELAVASVHMVGVHSALPISPCTSLYLYLYLSTSAQPAAAAHSVPPSASCTPAGGRCRPDGREPVADTPEHPHHHYYVPRPRLRCALCPTPAPAGAQAQAVPSNSFSGGGAGSAGSCANARQCSARAASKTISTCHGRQWSSDSGQTAARWSWHD